MGKKTTFILIIIAIILVIGIITYIKNPNANDITEETMKCIASKSHLYASSSCSHCEQQKEILGNYLSLINITDCLISQDICTGKDIRAVPTWIINDAEYLGVKSLNELKTLAGC